MNEEAQVIEIKGEGHPDVVTEKLTQTVLTSIRSHGDYYANIQGYLQSKKFPVFWIGGNLSFDFRKYSKEHRKDLFNLIKKNVIDEFKEIFPNVTLSHTLSGKSKLISCRKI